MILNILVIFSRNMNFKFDVVFTCNRPSRINMFVYVRVFFGQVNSGKNTFHPEYFIRAYFYADEKIFLCAG